METQTEAFSDWISSKVLELEVSAIFFILVLLSRLTSSSGCLITRLTWLVVAVFR